MSEQIKPGDSVTVRGTVLAVFPEAKHAVGGMPGEAVDVSFGNNRALVTKDAIVEHAPNHREDPFAPPTCINCGELIHPTLPGKWRHTATNYELCQNAHTVAARRGQP